MADGIVMVNGLPRRAEDAEHWPGDYAPPNSNSIRNLARLLHKIACNLDDASMALATFDASYGSIWLCDGDGRERVLPTGKMRLSLEILDCEKSRVTSEAFASADTVEYEPEVLPGCDASALSRIKRPVGVAPYNILDDVSRLLSDDHDEG